MIYDKYELADFATTALDTYTSFMSDKQVKKYKPLYRVLSNDHIPDMDDIMQNTIYEINHRDDVELDDRSEDLEELAQAYQILGFESTSSRYDLISYGFYLLSNVIDPVNHEITNGLKKSMQKNVPDDFKKISNSVFGSTNVTTAVKVQHAKKDMNLLIHSKDKIKMQNAINDMAKQFNTAVKVNLALMP